MTSCARPMAPVGGNGGTQIGQSHIDCQQQRAGQQCGAAHDLELLSRLGIALVDHALEHNDADGQGSQRVHGLIAGLDAGHSHIADLGQRGDLTQRRDDTLHNDHRQTQQQQRREDLAHDVHHGGLLDTQSQNQREKQHGEQHRGHTGQIGHDGHLIGGGRGAGNGQHGADAEDDGAHQEPGGDPADPIRHRLTAADPQQRKHSQQRQTDVREKIGGKPGHPLRARLHPQIRGKHHITRAEKHGKQRKTHHDHIPETVSLLLCTHMLLIPFSSASPCGSCKSYI